MPLMLSKESYEWALSHHIYSGDSDLFPRAFEFEAIEYSWSRLLPKLQELDLTRYRWSQGQSFLVPKTEYFVRSVTRLDPMDSLILSAVIKEFGASLESTRVSESERQVFSHRFEPTDQGRLYKVEAWAEYWAESLKRSEENGCNAILATDVTDYYNRIQHEAVEAQLRKSSAGDECTEVLMRFLRARDSCGVPVGPYSTHLLAEIAFNDIDRIFRSKQLNFCRYVDDMHFFCRSKEDAIRVQNEVVKTLDFQQKLNIQESKTSIMDVPEFQAEAYTVLSSFSEAPIGQELIEIISSHTDDDRYDLVSINELSEEERNSFTKEAVELALNRSQEADPSLKHMGWFLRRLSQVAIPEAIEFIVRNFRDLVPIISDVSRYLARAGVNFQSNGTNLGAQIINAFDEPIVRGNDYLQAILLNMFYESPSLNQTDEVISKFAEARPSVKRSIVLAAWSSNAPYWLREVSHDFEGADSWQRRAIILGISCLPESEAAAWSVQNCSTFDALEEIVFSYSFQQFLPSSFDLSSYMFVEEQDKHVVQGSELVNEVTTLVQNFEGAYRQSRIGSMEIMSWLSQFDRSHHPLMIELLKHVEFYSLPRFRDALGYLHKRVGTLLEGKECPKILVSAFGSPVKSGSTCARLYRQESGLDTSCGASLSQIPQRLREDADIDAIVFVEDVIGSGEDTIRLLHELDEGCGRDLAVRKIKVFIAAVCVSGDVNPKLCGEMRGG
ncbi:MAG: RNA-directed DNA polymerase [Candidatus Obscuribacterales bacterium]